MALLEQVPTAPSRVRTGAPPGEQGARRTLRRQIARLEAELGAAGSAVDPDQPILGLSDFAAAGCGGRGAGRTK